MTHRNFLETTEDRPHHAYVLLYKQRVQLRSQTITAGDYYLVILRMCNAKFALVGIAASLLLTMGASRTARAAGSAHCSSSAKITTRVARRHAAFLWKSCYDGPDTNKCAQGFVGVNCSSENLSLALYDDFQEAAKKDILMTRHDGQSLFNRTYETRACTKKKISCLEIDKEGHWKVEVYLDAYAHTSVYVALLYIVGN